MANSSESKKKGRATLGLEGGADTSDVGSTRKKGMARFAISSGVPWRTTDEGSRYGVGSKKDDQAPPQSKKMMRKSFTTHKRLSIMSSSASSQKISSGQSNYFSSTPILRTTPPSLSSVPELIDDLKALLPPFESKTHVDSVNTRHENLNANPQITGPEPQSGRQRSRRSCIDANSLTMGLDDESASFLDFMTQAKCEEWLRSLCRRDPRACIKTFFDDVARDGADHIEEEGGFQPELLSPLLATVQRSSVFSVWRPTSVESIRKMMTGQGTGKGLDIKGKSAKRGKLSAYVPFVQIHEDCHKAKIRALPRNGRIRIFYKKREARNKAHDILSAVMKDMMAATDAALSSLMKSDNTPTDISARYGNTVVSRIIAVLTSASSRDLFEIEDDANLRIVNQWEMDDPSIILIDNYSPKCFGLDLPKRLFWEGYVLRAKDISREPGSMYDTGRPSRPSFQDMNFASIKNECEDDVPRAVVWQYTDPYLPPSEPDPDPMMPQTLLMAYEENGRVMPVVSDFDCFLLGTRGVRFQNPLPDEQVELVHEMIRGVETILKNCKEGRTKNWTASWLNVMKHNKSHITMPKYGFGDPKSYAIMKHAVQRLEEFGAVRHGAECFNFYFPQELDEEFLVVRGTGSNLPIPKYKYMKLNELQYFLSGCIDLGFTFPLNPKWVLCDSGWKALWDKLTSSNHPNVQLSINAWYPPGSGLKECIENIHQHYPEGFSDQSGRKESTQAWDEAELDLERYKRIQRAKRKLRCILCFITILQQTQEKVHARHALAIPSKEGAKEASSNRIGGDSLLDTKHSHRYLGCSTSTASTVNFARFPTDDAIANMSDQNTGGLNNTQSANGLSFRRQSFKDDIEVVDSILKNVSSLSDFQKSGLRRIREQLVAPLLGRRHSCHNVRAGILALVHDEVPAFILNEYGGVQDDASSSFKDKVTKIINAHRLIGTGTMKCAEKWSSGGNEHFLPVEWTTLDLNSKQRLADKLSFDALSSWDFDITDLAKLSNGSLLFFVGWAIMGSPHAQQAIEFDLGQDSRIKTNGYNFMSQFNIKMPNLCSFFRMVEADYLPNPYHNSTHAADVLQTLNAMLHFGGKEYASSPLEIFSILVAAVIHDVGHPGLNNNFQIMSHSELAIQYNDISVLENNSIAWLFKKLLGQTRDLTIDIFSGLSEREFTKMRSIIISSVLETDMTHHFALLKMMGVHQEILRDKTPEEWSKSYSTNEGGNVDPSIDFLCFLLHNADISNPAKPYPLFTFWASNILSESYAQGDQEAALSLPRSPLCDRLTTDKKQSQIGFIKFVVLPSFQLLGDILPQFARTVLPHVARSLEYWENYDGNNDIIEHGSM
ncbi:hypothetical protein ACHAXA_006054 [Cyclostephanos tholiformis]|uniref:Phosphodiesterase n=1 Tax=Cyclostephanos tholiformis TaxID=382380 RepID=A0ABD3SAS0_9STRA